MMSVVNDLSAKPLVLVVDDDDDIREFAVGVLEDAGYAVVAAANGRQAVQLFEDDEAIELVFTDIRMPGMDGFILAEIAKARRPSVKIIYTTGYVDDARAKLGVWHGPLIEKPYRAPVLEARMREMLPLRPPQTD